MDWILVLQIYLCGIVVWPAVAALFDGKPLDRESLISSVIWPLCLASLVGQIIRAIWRML